MPIHLYGRVSTLNRPQEPKRANWRWWNELRIKFIERRSIFPLNRLRSGRLRNHIQLKGARDCDSSSSMLMNGLFGGMRMEWKAGKGGIDLDESAFVVRLLLPLRHVRQIRILEDNNIFPLYSCGPVHSIAIANWLLPPSRRDFFRFSPSPIDFTKTNLNLNSKDQLC